MKTSIISLCILLMLTMLPSKAQTLNLVGSSPSLNKGTINTEILLEIIQQKQEEVKRRVFRNTIVKQFNNSKSDTRLRNFTTYYFIYNMMDELVSGKNKKAMTKSIIANATEFAYVYGLALYVQKKMEANPALRTQGSAEEKLFNFIEKIDIPKKTKGYDFRLVADDKKHRFILDSPNKEDMLRFNLIVDLCLEVVRKSPDLKDKFDFKKDFADKEFQEWYKADNVFLKQYAAASSTTELDKYKTIVETSLKEIMAFKVKTDDSYKHLRDFYIDLEKSNFKDFTLTKDQYGGLKFIITKFLEKAKKHQDSNVLATIIDFFLENTIVEYHNGSEKLILETEVDLKKSQDVKGYLYIDIEALISAIDQRFATDTKEGFSVYVRPLLKIGTNYASFPTKNTLSLDADNKAKSLSNLYFASEKIGVEFKLINWKYTRSHAAGVAYKYFGGTKAWKRPQTVPLFSNLHVNLYGSGLLYNIANLKSETKFNYPIVGTNIGLTFFNGLSASVGFGSPIIDKKVGGTNNFYTFSLDIPIVEYIAALRKK